MHPQVHAYSCSCCFLGQVNICSESHVFYHVLSMLMLEDIFCCAYSVRSPKEDEWILDPVLIADTYGPEVIHLT